MGMPKLENKGGKTMWYDANVYYPLEIFPTPELLKLKQLKTESRLNSLKGLIYKLIRITLTE